MDIIRKFIPSNPLGAKAQETLKRIIIDTMSTFVKNYAISNQVVIVENKEAQMRYEEKLKEQRERRIAKNITIIGSIQDAPIIFGYLKNSSNRVIFNKNSENEYFHDKKKVIRSNIQNIG